MKTRLFPRIFISFLLVIPCLFLLTWSTAAAPGKLPTSDYDIVDGSWTGITSRGYQVSYTVSSSGMQWSSFQLRTDYFATSCGSSGTIDVSVPGPGSVSAEDNFSSTSATFSFTGHFNNQSTASGTYTFTNYQITLSVPFPPYVCIYYLNQSGTWTASTPLPVPGPFGKTAPVNGSIDQGLNPVLSWSASLYASSYEYCIDTVDNNVCDSTWINVSTSRTAHPTGLSYETTNYWQARAVNSTATTEADGGTWWVFYTGYPPAEFGKISPVQNAVNISTSPILTWEVNGGATRIEWCYDTVNNNQCDTGWWTSGITSSVQLSGLAYSTEYYWQVRAVNPVAIVEADYGTWWSFTTVPPVPGAFSKISPANGTTEISTSTTLTWSSSSNATSYEYCIDTSSNSNCETSWISTGSNLFVSLSGLSTNTTYYWHVRASNVSGTTYANNYSQWSFTTVSPPPGSFGKVSPTDGRIYSGASSVHLEWSTSSNASSYEYCVDTSNNSTCDTTWLSTGTSTNATLIDLNHSTTYYWQVKAINFSGTTQADSGTWWNFTLLPPAPGVLNKSGPANGSTNVSLPVTLSWSASSFAAYYEFCIDTTNNAACDTGWTSTGTNTTVEITGLSNSTTYDWQVRAVNAAGTTLADSGTWWSFTTQPPAPGPLAKTDPFNGGVDYPTSPTLTWTTSDNATSYDYCIDTSSNSNCDTSWISTGTNPFVALSGLTANTTYSWQVRAKNISGSTYADGGTWWSFTTVPPPPGPFGKSSPPNGATGISISPTLSWSPSSDVANYIYCIDTTNNNHCDTNNWTSNGTSTSVELSGLNGNTTYYWQAMANNNSGFAAADENDWWSFTTEATVPGAFGKSSPANGATSVSLSPTLSWTASSNTTNYEYCYDTVNNSTCDTTWHSVGTNTSVNVAGLNGSTTYYWQVVANNISGYTPADSGNWWSFTTLTPAPGAFGKTNPWDASLNISTSPSLAWTSSSGANSYDYCIDMSNNASCDATWTSTGTSTSVGLSGLKSGQVYYWQVRGVNAGGTTYGDAGVWWSFTTAPTFMDVPYTHWAWSWIERLFKSGITAGCSTDPLRYCPEQAVTRAQMAIFLERGINGPSYTPPPGTGTLFADVSSAHWAVNWIEKLYADGITAGCITTPLMYCPENAVSRAEMAVFLLRAKYGKDFDPPDPTGIFSDVPTTHWAAAWIEKLAADGITAGCGTGLYCPEQKVTRAQMAVFLVRTFELP